MKIPVCLIGCGLAAVLSSCEKSAPGFVTLGGTIGSVSLTSSSPASAKTPAPSAENKTASPWSGPVMVIKPDMPRKLIEGTPLPASNRPPNLDTNQEPVLEATIPQGAALLSRGKPVTSSDEAPLGGDISLVTDGSKDGNDGTYIDLAPGKQWIQVDLGESREIWLLWVWHFHKQAVMYNDVVAQVSDDPEFTSATTVFNNDYDNSSGFGPGKDLTYVETNHGRRIPVSGVKGRYVRFSSRGRDLDDTNQYIEIEVYGK